jgi:hypothetical protein
MSEEVRTTPPSDTEPKPVKPPVDVKEDGTWTVEVEGETLRFREATFDERSIAENIGATVAPNAPVNQMLGLSNEQFAQLLGLIVERKNQKGKWEPLTRALIGKRKDRFFFMTLGYYLAGLSVIGEQIKNLSSNSSGETTPIVESGKSMQP